MTSLVPLSLSLSIPSLALFLSLSTSPSTSLFLPISLSLSLPCSLYSFLYSHSPLLSFHSSLSHLLFSPPLLYSFTPSLLSHSPVICRSTSSSTSYWKVVLLNASRTLRLTFNFKTLQHHDDYIYIKVFVCVVFKF